MPKSTQSSVRAGFVPALCCVLSLLAGCASSPPDVATKPRPVTRENFVRAETDRMFSDFLKLTGGVNRFHHIRAPTPLDQQTVVRMNRDTVYSMAIIDTTNGGGYPAAEPRWPLHLNALDRQRSL